MSFRDVLTRRDAALFLEDVPVAELAREYGTPLYAYSRSALVERAERLKKAFGAAPHLIAYSVKSNMNLAVVQTFAELGCGFDVTSGGELERALRAGADPQKIVYSGVGKRSDEIDRALAVGIRMFNVESLDELAALDARGRALGKLAPISLRLNPDVDPKTHPKIATGLREAKFGIPIEEAPRAYAQAKTLSNVKAVGVDCHIGSQLLSLQPFRDALLRVKDTLLRLREDGHAIELIDVGGGLGVKYTERDQPPTPEAYAEMALEVVGGLEATLVCEPGRSLTAGAGVLISRVLYQKENSGKRFVIVDAAMNDYMRPALYDSPVRIETEAGQPSGEMPFDVVGPVCESTDRFAADCQLPELQNGDLIVLRDVGAYGFSMASTYNGRPLPAEVMVQGSRVETVRRRQTVEETWTGERIPDWKEK
jgi:diaminopimelate decarboxylase